MSYKLAIHLPIEIQMSGIECEEKREDLAEDIMKSLISSLFANNVGCNDIEVVLNNGEIYLFKGDGIDNYIYKGSDGVVILITSNFFDSVSVIANTNKLVHFGWKKRDVPF